MSTEDAHYEPETVHRINGRDLARMRQCLYDAKLALSRGDKPEATRKIIEALDHTVLW